MNIKQLPFVALLALVAAASVQPALAANVQVGGVDAVRVRRSNRATQGGARCARWVQAFAVPIQF